MLNRESMGVWMLADAAIGLLMAGFLGTVCWLPCLSTSYSSQEESRVERLRQQEEIEKLRSKCVVAQEQLSATQTKYEASKIMRGIQGRRIGQLTSQLDNARRAESQERHLRQELLGIQGSLVRPVFVIDISGSMGKPSKWVTKRPNWGGNGTPWSHVREQVKAWVTMLPVASFRIVCFNHALREFPDPGADWCDDQEDDSELLAFLESIHPDGPTGTERALDKALRYAPSSIILFTDGQPTSQKFIDGRPFSPLVSIDREQMSRILEKCRTGVYNVPINVVAVNNYIAVDKKLGFLAGSGEDPALRSFGAFLQEIAGTTGGAFIGL